MSATTSAVMNTYGRYPVAFVRGSGCYLWDEKGKRYLDFLSGIGVHALGHCHPAIVEAIGKQAATLCHTSNLYRIPLQEALAKRLTAGCFADQVFFCNSGSEANEAAIKLVRRYMKERGRPNRYEIITAHNSYHGRTLATLTASGQAKVQYGYDPLPPGFRYAPYNNAAAMQSLIGPHTAAIMVEAIQGEAGVIVPDDGYLEELRRIADHHGILLVVDEIQTGLGRTGKLWCHQWSDMAPDIMTTSKSLGGGLPMGACLATQKVAAVFSPGAHGSTFGGAPLACAAALAHLDILEQGDVLARVTEKGHHLLARLQDLAARHKMIKAIRGKGLMVAIELNAPAEEVVAIGLARGLLISCQAGTVLRLMPPLVVENNEIEDALTILNGVFTDLY